MVLRETHHIIFVFSCKCSHLAQCLNKVIFPNVHTECVQRGKWKRQDSAEGRTKSHGEWTGKPLPGLPREHPSPLGRGSLQYLPWAFTLAKDQPCQVPPIFLSKWELLLRLPECAPPVSCILDVWGSDDLLT